MTTVAAANSSVTYIHTDGLGSPVARTDASGNPISRTRYEPYGYVASGVQPTIGFTGHVNDVDTGLTYMQQRYYDPVAGRFLSIDPVVADANSGSSFNRYSYANNNPYRYLDPVGRDPAEKPVDKREEQLKKEEERARQNCQANCQFYSATRRSGSYNPGDVRGGFDAHGNSLVYSPENYDPNQASAVLIGIVSMVGVPEAGLLRLASEFRLVFRTSHYASRLEEAGLSVARTERLVGREVRSFARELAPNSDVVGRIRLKGVLVEYRARLLPGDVINIGTIFPVK
jgi:RHS repeat-associated protein